MAMHDIEANPITVGRRRTGRPRSDRLADATRNGSAFQSWSLDALGNWSSFTNNGSTQTRTANSQNQITSISGSATPLYDANGNMTTDQSGNTLVYDAWNRLVSVKNPQGTVIASYSYNAMGYRIIEDYPAGLNGNSTPVTKYLYYNSNWQSPGSPSSSNLAFGWRLLETRTNGSAASDVSSQMVWSAAYINAAILKDTYTSGTLQASSRLYFQYDANFDTTAVVGLVNGAWQVTQRYVYSPYGSITILNADWTAAPAGTVPLVANLYQGMQLDPATGLYYSRNRDYSPAVGNWIQQDPAGFINGPQRYGFVLGNPTTNVDTSGLLKFSVDYHLTPKWLVKAIDEIYQAAEESSKILNGVEKYIPGVTGFYKLSRQPDLEASIVGSVDMEGGTLCSASLKLEAGLSGFGFKAGLQASGELVDGRIGIFANGGGSVDVGVKYQHGKGWDFFGGGDLDVKGGIFGDITGADVVRVVASGGFNLSYGVEVNQRGDLTGSGEWNVYGSLAFQHREYVWFGSWQSTYTYTLSGSEHPFGTFGPVNLKSEMDAAVSAVT